KAFVWRYQRAQKKHPVKVLPITDKARCTACGLCAKVCPVAAISTECSTETAGSCIKCSACVKACPQRARTLPTPFAPVLVKNFKKQKPNIIIY
ncbi:MAG: 4Fe-4S binding protein, partial [Bacteroidaceae bacterium]|nr:4Fe-4S binding protein [Bacteroidaceae bacterium]